MIVYVESGYDGKERKFVYGNGYYSKFNWTQAVV